VGDANARKDLFALLALEDCVETGKRSQPDERLENGRDLHGYRFDHNSFK
jgi:hypothetical protein